MNGQLQNKSGKQYRKLRVWQAAHRFAMAVSDATKAFPSQEQFGLTSQLRRAALSVPTNIVEGQACRTRREFKSFLSIANRSLAESEYLLDVADELGYFENGALSQLDRLRYETGKLLQALGESL